MATAECIEAVPPEVLDAQSPQDARVPRFDPKLAVELDPDRPAAVAGRPAELPAHRLVTVGDSLTHGFQSGAIHNTHLAYPALVARELGMYDRFSIRATTASAGCR